MVKRLDRILVVDVESTCWEGDPPAGQESEIIEIGLCTLDVASLQRLEKRSILVRPERSTVSTYCTALTTLTQADVEAGILLVHHGVSPSPVVYACQGSSDPWQKPPASRRIGVPTGI